MATTLVDERDQRFVLKDMLGIEKLSEYEKFIDSSEYGMLLAEAHKFARAEFQPTLEPGDREGCVYDPRTSSVKVPGCYKEPYRKFCEGGWLAMCDRPEVGGFGFPLTVGTAVSEIFYAAGFYIFGAAELSHAGAKVIEKFGDQAQKDLYMTRLFSGDWMGTMCLTEPEAGSDVGRVKTKAAPKEDGSYSISGNKIFITAGEHDLTENIIHMVLARVEGDPPGTKGLSLFIVPKFLADQSGGLKVRNDVNCLGIERKMGLHGLVTCTLAFGENGGCTGYLLGERGRGIVEMFNMMNEQRLLVGLQGLAYSSSAFLHAVNYAAERKQGPSTHPDARDKSKAVAIIEHPDVRRILLTMKAQVEGGRALAYFTSLCMDLASVTQGGEQAEWRGLAELLTPVVKAYLTGQSWEVTGMAIQCAGGYGYCSDYPFERLARDCKITTIYEGTNGIQAIDLLFRKILADDLVNFDRLMKRMESTIATALKVEGLEEFARAVEDAKLNLAKCARYLASLAAEGQAPGAYAKAGPFLEAMGDAILGWMHLWQLTIVHPRLKETLKRGAPGEKPEDLTADRGQAFLYGKDTSARFFIGTLLKRTQGKFQEIMSSPEPVLGIFNRALCG